MRLPQPRRNSARRLLPLHRKGGYLRHLCRRRQRQRHRPARVHTQGAKPAAAAAATRRLLTRRVECGWHQTMDTEKRRLERLSAACSSTILGVQPQKMIGSCSRPHVGGEGGHVIIGDRDHTPRLLGGRLASHHASHRLLLYRDCINNKAVHGDHMFDVVRRPKRAVRRALCHRVELRAHDIGLLRATPEYVVHVCPVPATETTQAIRKPSRIT